MAILPCLMYVGRSDAKSRSSSSYTLVFYHRRLLTSAGAGANNTVVAASYLLVAHNVLAVDIHEALQQTAGNAAPLVYPSSVKGVRLEVRVDMGYCNMVHG